MVVKLLVIHFEDKPNFNNHINKICKLPDKCTDPGPILAVYYVR